MCIPKIWYVIYYKILALPSGVLLNIPSLLDPQLWSPKHILNNFVLLQMFELKNTTSSNFTRLLFLRSLHGILTYKQILNHKSRYKVKGDEMNNFQQRFLIKISMSYTLDKIFVDEWLIGQKSVPLDHNGSFETIFLDPMSQTRLVQDIS